MGIKRNPVTYEQCKELMEAGYLVSEIAKKLGCSEFLVYSRLDNEGIKKQRHVYNADRTPKVPIMPEEIERYKSQLKIGDKVYIEIRDMDGDLVIRDQTIRCQVTEKYRWHFLGKDKNGRRYSMTYIEMIIKGRGA